MKKFLVTLILITFVLSCGCQKAPKEVTSDETSSIIVYVSKTGIKYHKKNCMYLKYSCREITLKQALYLDYNPCSVCNPPIKVN